ncbi:MAG: hypothetical protein JWM88_1357 [Verrucomicrobia bacterium]|nr:hypothetical protein [Verrucomicrobiota bacterium]
MAAAAPLPIGGRLELFVDRYLIDHMEGLRLTLQRPQLREIVFRFDQPWEQPFAGAVSIVKDGPTYMMYYRGVNRGANGDYDGTTEVSCYAESTDGIHWVRPNLGLFEYRGSKANNIILPSDNPHHVSHNLMVTLDPRPGVPPAERFKAIGGTRKSGLFRYVSGDGIHWKLFSEQPIFVNYALDTLNVLTWSPAENCYVIYLRTWSGGGTPSHPKNDGVRTISRSTSADFATWTEPQQMEIEGPLEDIYTNGTHPYFRAPHILIALPFRFSPDRQVYSDEMMTEHGVHFTQRKGLSDGVLMTSRGGNRYDRTFMESFIRPGPDFGAWVARSSVPAVGVVPTGEREMSIYTTTHHTTPDYHVRRYSLRTDGFSSVNAPYAGGELVTKPLVFSGAKLVLNYETSASGGVQVEVQDEAGHPLPGFSLAESPLILGDEIDREVKWASGSSLAALAGRPVRLRFVMKDADLYSLQFRP